VPAKPNPNPNPNSNRNANPIKTPSQRHIRGNVMHGILKFTYLSSVIRKY